MANRKYYEFTDGYELDKHFKRWSNSCGKLHTPEGRELNSRDELPEPLKKAYEELWDEGNGCLEYLAEYDGKYYAVLAKEFDLDFAEDHCLHINELYRIVKENAKELHRQSLFKNTILITGDMTGADGCHEILFLIPPCEQKKTYDEIAQAICDHIWNGNGKKVLNVTCTCIATYTSSILVPEYMTIEEAMDYAEQNLDVIPINSDLSYVPDSDQLDRENCNFEDDSEECD